MANEALRKVIQHLHRVAGVQGGGRPSDAELLERYTLSRDHAAFEVLVWRHGPMVLNLCRRIVRHEQDAEDAFQATFLTLVRKAGSIAKREAIGSWLYKVAYRVALEANARTVQRARRETANIEALPSKPHQDLAERELQVALGEEVSRLPERYRVPLVLHCFEGKTSQELALQLGCAESTVRTRLARARERLRTRLVRRGLACSGAVLAGGLASGPIPAALVDTTVQAAAAFGANNLVAGKASASAAVLAERMLRIMFLNKVKHLAAAVFLVGIVSAGTGISIHEALAERPAAQGKEKVPKSAERDVGQPDGDPVDIRGTWEQWVRAQRSINGKPLPPQKEKITYVITDNEIMRAGEDSFLDEKWSYRLDSTKRPKAIDLVDRVYGTVPGIYYLEGDTLKLAFDFDGKRPAEFPGGEEAAWVLKRVNRTFAPIAERFPNAPGCFWMVKPHHPSVSAFYGGPGVGYIYDKDRDGAAVITLSYFVLDLESRRYRPVLLDDQGKRHLPASDGGGSAGFRRGQGSIVLSRWRMDPVILPANNVAQFGIEVVTTDARRLAARDALARAKTANIDVLPWPEPGEPFRFAFTTVDGRKIRSADLKGKVVLIDCWATWCSPCMALMPELKTLYKKWQGQGLEIVGVSLDRDLQTMRETCKSAELPWPQVFVPDDERIRSLWHEASGIGSIPRLLLIDQQGILRDPPGTLEEKVVKLLKGKSGDRPAKPKP